MYATWYEVLNFLATSLGVAVGFTVKYSRIFAARLVFLVAIVSSLLLAVYILGKNFTNFGLLCIRMVGVEVIHHLHWYPQARIEKGWLLTSAPPLSFFNFLRHLLSFQTGYLLEMLLATYPYQVLSTLRIRFALT